MNEIRKDNKGRKLKVGESQRKDGMYQYRYIDMLGNRQVVYSWKLMPSDTTPDGKKEDICLRDKEKKIELLLLQNLDASSSKYSFNDMFDRYVLVKKHKGKKLTENTINNYKSMWNKNVRESQLGKMRIIDIKRSHLIQFYEELQENDISYGTITFFNKVFSAVFNMAINEDIIMKNPTRKVMDEIEGMQNCRCALSVAQQKEFLNFLYRQDRALYRKVAFSIETMIRVSELAGITWNDIDMREKIIMIDHQMIYKKFKDDSRTTYHITETKNKQTRIIPMSENAYKILLEYKRRWYMIGKDYEVDGKSGFVFFSKSNSLINYMNFNNELKRAVENYNKTAKNKIEEISPHVLRHTGCTRNAEDGMPIKELQYMMGHASTQITNEIYNHVDVIRARKALENVENIRKMRA